MKLGRPNVSAEVEDAIKERLAAGDGILRTAKALGVGVGRSGSARTGKAPILPLAASDGWRASVTAGRCGARALATDDEIEF